MLIHGDQAGIYKDGVVPSGDELQGNCKVSYYKADFIITKAPADQNAITATGYKGTYDGQPHTIVAGTKAEGSKLLYSLDGEKWLDAAPEFTDVTPETTIYVKHPGQQARQLTERHLQVQM